ncbi:MAG: hypothetical protein ACI8WW_002945 [Oceanospirillaceae bacterium]|jgi:hypothetical protein
MKKEENSPAHIAWVADELRRWAETWHFHSYAHEESKEEDDAYYFVKNLALKLETDNCSKEDYDHILFHLWQKLHE